MTPCLAPLLGPPADLRESAGGRRPQACMPTPADLPQVGRSLTTLRPPNRAVLTVWLISNCVCLTICYLDHMGRSGARPCRLRLTDSERK
jgi:hypothetical protein